MIGKVRTPKQGQVAAMRSSQPAVDAKAGTSRLILPGVQESRLTAAYRHRLNLAGGSLQVAHQRNRRC